MLLCLWRRPAATALIRSLAWALPYAAGAALKRRRSMTMDIDQDKVCFYDFMKFYGGKGKNRPLHQKSPDATLFSPQVRDLSSHLM